MTHVSTPDWFETSRKSDQRACSGAIRAMSAMGGESTFLEPVGSRNLSDHRKALKGRTVLLVEDEVMIAMEIEFELEDCGAKVLGPIARLEDALGRLQPEAIDVAILDVNLHGKMIYPVADILVRENVPIVFHTGNASSAEIQAQYPDAIIVKKPTCMDALLEKLATVLPNS